MKSVDGLGVTCQCIGLGAVPVSLPAQPIRRRGYDLERFPALRLVCIEPSAHCEPTDEYVDQFPWLQDVLVHGSDYPHYEGGSDPSAQFAERLARFGP